VKEARQPHDPGQVAARRVTTVLGKSFDESNFDRSKGAQARRDVLSLWLLCERAPLYSGKHEQGSPARTRFLDCCSRTTRTACRSIGPDGLSAWPNQGVP
jgi:hypothetical protein